MRQRASPALQVKYVLQTRHLGGIYLLIFFLYL